MVISVNTITETYARWDNFENKTSYIIYEKYA